MKRTAWMRMRDILKSKRELARLNHILIPATKADRDRYRQSKFALLLRPWMSGISALSREGRAVFMLTLLIGFAGLDVARSQIHLLFAMLVGLIFVSLVTRPLFRARTLVVKVEAPRRVTMDAVQRFTVHLSNQGTRTLAGIRLLTPFLPWDGRWQQASAGVAVIEPGREAVLTAEATFMARGEHHIDPFEAALLVPMGLALGPRRASEAPHFVVVPRFATVVSVKAPALAPRANGKQLPSLARGDAEFGGVRPYRVGDSLRHLHARTWARTGKPHVKTFLAERNDKLGLFILTDGAEASRDAKEATLMLAAGVTRHLLETGDALERLLIGREVLRLNRASGRACLDVIMDRLGLLSFSDEQLQDSIVVDGAAGLSSLLLIACDTDQRRSTVLKELRNSGLPVRAIFVTADGQSSVSDFESFVPMSAIEQGTELRC